jgi:nucleoside phosphorylase
MIKVIKKISKDIRIYYGLIVSGNQVIKNVTRRNKLNKDLDDDVLYIKMKIVGLIYNFPCIVIRGICDYADSYKNKKW